MIELVEAFDTIEEKIAHTSALEIHLSPVIINKPAVKLTERIPLKHQNRCPYCNQYSAIVWVHGHYQCQLCKNVIASCCGTD